MRVGFAGAGNMAAAMARGWAGAEAGPGMMLFCDLEAQRARRLADEVEGETRPTLGEIAAESDVVLLAVKPDALDDVAREIDGTAPAILSVMAATTTERLGAAFVGVPILRVMPNQPVEVRHGVLCHVSAVGMPEELETRLLGLLEQLGTVIEVREDEMEAAMAVMSCSPAYVALFAEALAEAGVREGLDRDLSAELVAQTLAGTAELLYHHDHEAVRAAVAPPGGATEAGLAALEHGGFKKALDAAVDASLERFR